MKRDMKSIHIFNGTAMLSYHQVKYPDSNKIYTSFNEAMCWGDTTKDIFSEEFIEARCYSLNTNREEYVNNVINPLSPLLEKEEHNITLWFDSDMFCQINLITLLAYLDQLEYRQNVKINLVDYNHNILATSEVIPTGYQDIYESVLIDKLIPNESKISEVMQQGIKLYLNLQTEENEIVCFIKKSKHLPKSEILNLLLKNFQNYGLGDLQYKQVIEEKLE